MVHSPTKLNGIFCTLLDKKKKKTRACNWARLCTQGNRVYYMAKDAL